MQNDYDNYDIDELKKHHEDLKNTLTSQESQSRLDAIKKEYERRDQSGDPDADEYLRDSLLDLELKIMEKEGGGKWSAHRTRKAPELRKGKFSPISGSSYSDKSAFTANIIKTATSIGIGAVVSAVFGSAYLFFGFLLIGISALLPSPNNIKSIADKIDSMTNHYKNRLESAVGDEKRKVIEAEMNLEIARITTMAGLKDMGLSGTVGTTVVVKEVFKALGLAVISLGFLISEMPMAKPIAVVVALVAYFALTFKREDADIKNNTGGRVRL